MAKNFSDKYLTSLKPKVKQYQVREAKGFALRVLPSGCKTFLFIYEVDGKRKQLNLGNYPSTSLAEAREAYNEAAKRFSRGEPVVKEPEPIPTPELTVKGLIDQYLKSTSANTAAWEDAKKSVLHNRLTEWHNLPVTAIKKQDAVAFIERSREYGDGSAAGTARIASALFNYAVEIHAIEYSPFTRIKRVVPSIRIQSRTRFLSEIELVLVLKKIDSLNVLDSVKRALKVILFTAQRPGEVRGMHRREIAGDWWTIPAERNQKGKRDHRVFLTKTVKELIGDSQGYIFESDSLAGYISNPYLSVTARKANLEEYPRWTPHDLRRTARTHFSRLRIPREHGEAILNHAKPGMVGVYDQYEFDDEKKEALQKWEAEVLRLVAQSSSSE